MVRFTQIQKRDGRIVDFDSKKIEKAIHKALIATSQGDGDIAKKLTQKVLKTLEEKTKGIPTVEQVQDIVEEALILGDYIETAKAYILYRDQHRKLREMRVSIEDTADMVDQYIGEMDWEVRENSNMSYSLQGLNNYVSSAIIKKYWLNKVYPPEVREAAAGGDIHIHNLQTLGPYCCGWDLYDLLLKGFGGVFGKMESKPPKHLRSTLGQIVNFFYTLQGEAAGAEAFSSFDTFLAPFVRYDNLTYEQVKQAMQEFLFNCNVPTRVGFQTPFTNITMDVKVPEILKKQPVIIGGKAKDETYGEFQNEMDLINKAFAEVMMEGDAKGRPFTFPIPTYNITKDFNWENPIIEPVWEMTAKYGIPYFSNFINSEMKPDDVRSMCCRLRLDNRELYHRGGGLFGSNPLTGSVGVVTINMPRIGYLSKTKKEFFDKLGKLMDIAKESLEIKRKTIEDLTEKGLYPYSRHYLEGVKKIRGGYWGNHFSTIGLVGLNEAILNFKPVQKNIGAKEGNKFAKEVLDFMRSQITKYQQDDGGLYNLEATPAEGTSFRLAKKDKEKYPDIVTSGTKEKPYYTNSSQLPVNYTDDIFEALDLQDDLQTKYTGGTVLHIFMGEKISETAALKSLIKKTFTKYNLPYVTISPTFSICPVHGYMPGEHFACPKCIIDQPCEVYSRIVGYLRPVQQWNEGKQQEFKQRKNFKISQRIS
ncbi:MAG: ribonucleoside triphosphate reductase [Candidatus Pacebacteria bacterium]|nr:ribonucleoside triphosphate reductase [Candidatus Paceibacterota bacterium]